MEDRFMYKLNSLVIALIFFFSIFIPFSIGIFEKDKSISEVEKRKLAKFPTTPENLSDIKKFPILFDSYYSDHFGLRDWFTKYYKLAKYHLGDSPSEDVTIGKNGWLFLGSIKKGYTEYNDPIGDFRGVNLYSQKDLENVAVYITGLKAWLKEKGIEYLLLIAPNKHSIYFDQLPNYISRRNADSATDQLVKYIRKHTEITIIDPRDILINEKAKYQLYYKTDTHWNSYAANIVQYKVFTEIEKLFPGVIQPEMQGIKISERRGGDLASLIGINIFKEPHPQPIFEQTCEPTMDPPDATGRETYTLTCEDQKLKAVIFMDSFFTALQPYFSRKFYRSTYIWEKLNYPSLIKYIALENPDIIIEEWVERSLPYVPEIHHEFTKSLYKIKR